MKSSSPVVLISVTFVTAVLGFLYGMFQVTHGHPLPVAHASSLVTMPAIAAILAAIAIPVFRYRRLLLEISKASNLAAKTGVGSASGAAPRPKRLDPFYAVRVLLLAKSTAVASAVIGGFQLGLVLLQLTTPVVAASVWLNVTGVVGAVISLIVALIVERACKIQDGGMGSAPDEVAA